MSRVDDFLLLTQFSDITLQHVSSSIGPSLTSSAHPSQTSATKFLNQRLYSKKRQVAVLASSAPQPNQERNPKKQKKGGLSLETRLLLGLDEPEDAEKEKQREKKKKRNLLLQAEGQRKAGTFAVFRDNRTSSGVDPDAALLHSRFSTNLGGSKRSETSCQLCEIFVSGLDKLDGLLLLQMCNISAYVHHVSRIGRQRAKKGDEKRNDDSKNPIMRKERTLFGPGFFDSHISSILARVACFNLHFDESSEFSCREETLLLPLSLSPSFISPSSHFNTEQFLLPVLAHPTLHRPSKMSSFINESPPPSPTSQSSTSSYVKTESLISDSGSNSGMGAKGVGGYGKFAQRKVNEENMLGAC